MEYALDRVISVAGTYAATNSKKGITEGDIAFLADQVTDPSLSFTSETEDIVDARNNVVIRNMQYITKSYIIVTVHRKVFEKMTY